MKKSVYPYIKRTSLILLIFILLFAGKCNRGYRAILKENARKEAVATRTKNLIATIKGIKYTEVHRKFDNGLSFSPIGYQLIPEWKISFPSIDSVNIYSPKKGKFLNAPVVFDHDSIFNVAWAWLRLKQLSKDSLKFMVLHVKDNIILDEKVHVFMTFYSNSYIKDVLHSDTTKLWAPSRTDSLYIKAKVSLANRIPDSAFAGTEPALLASKSKLISVKIEAPADAMDGGKSYDAYLSPTYNIVINKAYDNFSYSFTAWVDDKGNLIFRKSIISLVFLGEEGRKSYINTLKAITDGYLKLYLNIKPGKTLGIPHSSIIFINVQGYKK
ncbi:MAG TPA: hypothetical protein VGN20_11585 [Mucilaginibacter sp.]|jgi:hypothetical protein